MMLFYANEFSSYQTDFLTRKIVKIPKSYKVTNKTHQAFA